jgi:hypothetical protein
MNQKIVKPRKEGKQTLVISLKFLRPNTAYLAEEEDGVITLRPMAVITPKKTNTPEAINHDLQL